MSDEVCIGVCIIDPQTGACMGCGRMPDEVVESTTRDAASPSTCPTGISVGHKKIDTAPPLPPQVAAEAQNPSD